MGQKINPISLRLQNTNRYFDFCWYNDFFYSDLISQDLKIQKYLNSIFKQLQYPTGRFFIQSSQKKIKIFTFFCSPKKSRKIRSNYFKIKYYKTSKKSLTLKKNKISNFLRKYPIYDKKSSSWISETTKRITIGDENFSGLNQRKSVYLKYLLYRKYVQNFYGSNKKKFLFDNWLRPSTAKENEGSLLLLKRFNSKLKNPNNSNKNETLIEDGSYQSVGRGDSKGSQDSLFFQTQPDLFQVEFTNKKLKKSRTVTGSVFKKNKRFDSFSSLAPSVIMPVKMIGSFFFDQNFKNLNLYQSIGLMTYRKHMERVLSHDLSMNVNIHSLKTYDHFRSALFLAEEIVYYLEKRKPFRRIKNRILREVKFLSAIKGIRISCSGRVGGRSKKAQRAKIENIKYGQTSLHVFSSRIDFASKTALTAFGLVGIKVWICYKD